MTIKKVAERSTTKKEGPKYNKTHDLRCPTRSIYDIFHNMSNNKKAIVEKLKFAAMTHIPTLNVLYKLLKESAYSFDLYNSTLHMRYGAMEITPEKNRRCPWLECIW
ncbi:hypothetical protein AHAS_Ahas06G0143500 [Arachis hypogaea]